MKGIPKESLSSGTGNEKLARLESD